MSSQVIDAMFAAGAHFGLGRSKRNPTIASYIFSTKNRTDIFDLEKTSPLLTSAKEYIASLAKENKTVLFVGGKKEAISAISSFAQSINMPFVASRWIGGTLTNFPQIRKRMDRYEKLISDKEKGEFGKYTKREKMLLDKEIAKLERMFAGIIPMRKLPDALFVIDPGKEHNAVDEALSIKIPVIALSSSDCDISKIHHPIIGNDSSRMSISFFVEEIAKAYKSGKGIV